MIKTLLFFIVFFSLTAQAQTFENFQKILNKHLTVTELSNGGLQSSFDYQEAYKDIETRKLVEAQTKILKSFPTKSLVDKNQALAFWINSYNFFMVKTVLEKGFKKGRLNINSVKDLGSFFSPYKIFTQESHNIGGKKMSLDQIEKGTLLGDTYRAKKWKDARIHFAVNCASVGCPPIIKNVYEANSLDKVLDQNVEQSLRNQRHFFISGKTLHLTHLFKWYKKDFIEHSGSVEKFLKKYLKNSKIKSQIDEAKDTKHIKYDWNLNISENFKQSK